jgi:hypothetical protein
MSLTVVSVASMDIDYKNLTLKVPWRDFISAVCGEENNVHRQIESGMSNLYRMADEAKKKVARGELGEMDLMMMMVTAFGDKHKDAYSVVRDRRLGYQDPAGDQYLKDLRSAASWASLLGGDDAEEEEKDG